MPKSLRREPLVPADHHTHWVILLGEVEVASDGEFCQIVATVTEGFRSEPPKPKDHKKRSSIGITCEEKKRWQAIEV